MIKHVYVLMPVAYNYAEYLKELSVEESRIHTIPCNVPVEKFHFSKEDKKMRQKFGIGNHETVGIYAGKFGGLYCDEEAFWLFRKGFE